MTIAICQGCGRRASAGEVHCAACGRALTKGELDSPPGWVTADLPDHGPVRPAAVPEAAQLSAEEVASLYVPAAARRTDGGGQAGGAPRADRPEAREADIDPDEISAIPGGVGWRVRVSAAQRAVTEEAEEEEVQGLSSGRRKLPHWVLNALLVVILTTSAAAALLIILHVMNAG